MKKSYFLVIIMSVFVISVTFLTGAFAQNDSAFKYDPTLQYGSKPQTPAETPEQLHKKLVNAKDAISNIMGSKMGDIPFNAVSVDEVNSILDVGIDSSKATLSEEQYLKKIREIVGDIPIKITFGQISSLPLILTNNSVHGNNASASNGVMKSTGPVVITLESPLKQFKSGTDPHFVICNQNLQLVIKSSNNSPACVKPEHVTRLMQNGWTLSNPFNRIADTDVSSTKSSNLKQIHYYDSSNLNPKASLYDYSYDGIDKGGLVSINNQTFYQTTLDNDIYKLKGISRQFHNVTFSFPEGTLTTPGGAFVNLDVKFKDGFEEIYGGTTYNPDGSGSVGGISIPTQYGPHLATNSITVLGNHTMPQAGLTIYKDKIKLLVSADYSSLQTIHTVSLGDCDVPYESRTGFVSILYMPTGSTGKVCVDYSNGNEPTTVIPSVFDAQNLSQNTNDISVSPLQANIVHGNSTVVYTITSGNKAGFYGLTIFCYGTPIAVGYDNQSRIVTGDFPWLNHTYYCMLRSYDYHITGVGGSMGIKYVPP